MSTVPEERAGDPDEDRDLTGDVAVFGTFATILAALIIVLWTVFIDGPSEVHADTGWHPMCAATAEIETTQIIPFGGALGMVMGGSPVGPSSRTVTTTICQRTVWRCASGHDCDPAKRPGPPEEAPDAP